MNIINILKDNELIRPIFRKLLKFPKTWQAIFNFENIDYNIRSSKAFILNGVSVVLKDRIYICIPFNYKKPNDIDLKLIDGINYSYINSLNNLDPLTFKKLEEVIFYVYLDLIISFLKKSDEFIEVFFEKENLFNRFYRPNILEINKSSIYLERLGKDILNNKIVPVKICDAVLDLKIKSLELPSDYDTERTVFALNEMKKIMDFVKLPIKSRNFNLKFKKLGTFKDNGFYSFETNTIIIDPRFTNVFVHELGHMIYDNKLKINKSIKASNSEDYAQKFYANIFPNL